MTFRGKMGKKNSLRGRDRQMNKPTRASATVDLIPVVAEMAVYGKPFAGVNGDRSGVSPGIQSQSAGLTSEDVLLAAPSQDIIDRGGALTVQLSVAEEGAWRIFPCGSRVCISVLFQRDLRPGVFHVVAADVPPWDRPEYAEQISFFVGAEVWKNHAPQILLRLRDWVRLNARYPVSQETPKPHFMVSSQARSDRSDPAAAVIAGAIQAGVQVTYDHPISNTVELLSNVLSELPQNERLTFTAAVNWMRHFGESALNLHAGPPASPASRKLKLERIVSRTKLGGGVRRLRPNELAYYAISSAGLAQDMAKNLEALVLGSGPAIIKAEWLSDSTFVSALDEVIEIWTCSAAVDFVQFVENRLVPAIQRLFRCDQMLDLAAWQNLALNRHVARAIGMIALEAEAELGAALADGLFLLNAGADVSASKRLSETMINVARWRRCQWHAILVDDLQQKLARRRIKRHLDNNCLPPCLRESAARLLIDCDQNIHPMELNEQSRSAGRKSPIMHVSHVLPRIYREPTR